MRNGSTPSRGGASIRGRGNLNGKGGYSGMNVNNERRYVPVKNNGKDENLVYEEMQKQGIEKDNVKTNDAQLRIVSLFWMVKRIMKNQISRRIFVLELI